MNTDDPRFATFPAEPGMGQLRWLIAHTASGVITVPELHARFRPIHEALERQGRVPYSSREEARLIWDVLWVLEFYTTDPAREENPDEWNDAAAVLTEIRRVADALRPAA